MSSVGGFGSTKHARDELPFRGGCWKVAGEQESLKASGWHLLEALDGESPLPQHSLAGRFPPGPTCLENHGAEMAAFNQQLPVRSDARSVRCQRRVQFLGYGKCSRSVSAGVATLKPSWTTPRLQIEPRASFYMPPLYIHSANNHEERFCRAMCNPTNASVNTQLFIHPRASSCHESCTCSEQLRAKTPRVAGRLSNPKTGSMLRTGRAH